MKRIIITATAAVSLFFASCTNGSKNQSAAAGDSAGAPSAAVTPANATTIKFEKNSYEFGAIKEGEKVSHDFKFTNAGEKPLIISNATASCGCTVPDYPRQPIAPGESAVIKVVFDSTGKSGMQNKVVTITSNTEPSTTELFLVGEVKGK